MVHIWALPLLSVTQIQSFNLSGPPFFICKMRIIIIGTLQRCYEVLRK